MDFYKIRKAIETIADEIKNQVAHNADEFSLVMDVLPAYNHMQEEEHDGVDYVFNIHNTDDLATCCQGGLTADEIVELCRADATWFFFGQNYDKPQVLSYDRLRDLLVNSVEEVVKCAFLDPGQCEYARFMSVFLSYPIIESNIRYSWFD